MIDIHPPQHAAITRRDFFIHLFIVVLGILIAIGLEQSVEYIHHRHERHQLREDLRSQAEQQIRLLHQNQLVCAESIAWNRAIIHAGRDVIPAAGVVTFVLPSRKGGPPLNPIANGVWAAAKSSGGIALLSRDEIVSWNRVDDWSRITDISFGDRETALQKIYAIMDRTDNTVAPGATIRLKTEDRDELMRDIGSVIEATWMIERNSALWEGANQAVLHGATSPSEMAPYEGRTLNAMPK